MGSVAWLGAFLIPPTTNLASIPLAGPDYLWFRTSRIINIKDYSKK